jgi:hypothetical protein
VIENVSTELVLLLARYASLPLQPDRAEALARVLGPALARLRALRPEGYENLAPGINFRVPVPARDDTQE